MQTYKVEYYTSSKGRKITGSIGNLRQFNNVAYIQCLDTSKVKGLLENFYSKPIDGLFYIPVITKVTAVEGHCIVEINN